jgi:hypothetical protein
MSFEKRTSSSGLPPIFVSPALISMILVVCVFLFSTWRAFSTQNFAWLVIIPGIPMAVFFLNRRDYFFLAIVIFTSANIWVPVTGNDVPFHIFLRMFLAICIIGASIISRPPASRWDLTRISFFCWAAVILMTMAMRGTGIRQFGSSLWGGKNYIILLSMLLFVAVIPQSVRLSRKQWLGIPVMMAFLPVIPLLADLLYILSGGKLYFLYYIFKPAGGVAEATTTLLDEQSGWRIQGTSRIDLLILLLFVMPRLGRTPHGKLAAAIIFVAALALSSMGGFRGALLGGVGVTLFYAWFRAPNRRMLICAALLAGFAGLVAVAHFAARYLPSPVQRVLTIVPFARVEPIVEIDAIHSARWRFQIWETVLQTEVRPHLIVGRGFCFDPNRLIPQYGTFVDEWSETQNNVTNTNFHSGPLSSLVLFGLPGFISLLVFMLSSSFKHLRIHRLEWHDPMLRHIHFVFLCYHLYSTISFYLIYGDLSIWMTRYLYVFCFLEMLANARQDEVDRHAVEAVPEPLLTEPVRTRAIRYF